MKQKENRFPILVGYTIESELGSGGFGISYQAHRDHDLLACVIKGLSFKRLRDWKSLELFEREAKVLAALNHPHIPQFLEYIHTSKPTPDSEDDDDAEVFLIQTFIPGQSLQAMIEKGRHLSEAQVIKIALSICEILVYLQNLSPALIHRDIKPSNIIIDPSDQVFLIDFGAVKDTFKHKGGSTVVGTFGYMAPEQFQGRAIPASDIYSLGATLLFLLSHQEPQEFNAEGLKLDIRSSLKVSNGLLAILEKMLEPNYENRYLHAQDLHDDLKALEMGQVPAVLFQDILVHNHAQENPQSKKYFSRFMAVLFAFIILLLVFIAFKPQSNIEPGRENYEAIKQRLEKTYEETYRAEFGPPPQKKANEP
jgi:serine/threonine protein kinase